MGKDILARKKSTKSCERRFLGKLDRNYTPITIEEGDDGLLNFSLDCTFFSHQDSTSPLDDDDDDEINGGDDMTAEQRRIYWESQHLLLQEILEQYDSIGSILRQEMKKQIEIARDLRICNCKRECTTICLRRAAVDQLCSKGFNASLCVSHWKATHKTPSGSHEYIEVLLSTQVKKKQIPFVVELGFRDEFKIAKASEEYKKLVNQLPHVYIGKWEHMKAIIRLVCEAAKRSAEEQKIHMGPWRNKHFMQMKWSPSNTKFSSNRAETSSSSADLSFRLPMPTSLKRANSPHHSSQRAILVDHRFFSRFFPAVDRRLEFNSWRFRGLEAMETAARGTGIIATGENLPAFKLLVSSPEGLSPSEVSVVFDQKYDRIPHPDMSLENSVAEMWERRVQQNPSLFNGLKFRYGGHTLGNGPDSSQKTNVCIHLGLTDYRTFVGTNLNPLWERFLIPSEDDWRRCQHTSNPLGNGAIVETSNKEVVILQRSANVGEFPEHFVFPGGHPEPKEVGIEAHQMDGNLTQQMVDKRVSLEMFDSIIREVVEEIGVPSATLSKPLFIGISQRVLNVRPAAFFFIKCSLPSEEVQQFYSNAEDGYESTKLYTMPTSDLSNVTSKMPGCHQGGFALYKLMLDAGKEK